jgi:hypothetical protein
VGADELGVAGVRAMDPVADDCDAGGGDAAGNAAVAGEGAVAGGRVVASGGDAGNDCPDDGSGDDAGNACSDDGNVAVRVADVADSGEPDAANDDSD